MREEDVEKERYFVRKKWVLELPMQNLKFSISIGKKKEERDCWQKKRAEDEVVIAKEKANLEIQQKNKKDA